MNERSSPEARVPIESIRIVDRHRKDMGDLADLAESIADLGLIQPVVLTADRLLIAGHRRVEACRRLGWDTIPSVTAAHLFDAVDRLRAERDENTCRKSMTPSELVALGRDLEALERPNALERKRASLAKPGEQADNRESLRGRPRKATQNEPLKHGRSTDAIVGKALGVGESTYYRAKVLVTAAEDGDQRAAGAVAEMDRTGKVSSAYRSYKDSPAQDAPAPVKPRPAPQPVKDRAVRATPRKNVASTVYTLRGLALALADVEALDPAITTEEAADWDRDLSKALRVLRSFHTKVKEHAHGNS